MKQRKTIEQELKNMKIDILEAGEETTYTMREVITVINKAIELITEPK